MACTSPKDQQEVECHRGLSWEEAMGSTVGTFTVVMHVEEEACRGRGLCLKKEHCTE